METFAALLESFLDFAEKVLRYDVSGDMRVFSSQNTGLLAGLNGYREVFSKTRTSAKHLDKFREIYAQCKGWLQKCHTLDQFMEWFRETNFVVEPTEKSRRKLYVSAIYRNCLRVATHLSEEAERYKDRGDQILSDPAAVYPEQFMLYLFRIFSHCANPPDAIITQYIDELQKTLNVDGQVVPASSDGLGDFISIVRDIAPELGVNIPKDAPSITVTQLKVALGEVTHNKEFTGMLKNVLGGINFNDPKNIPTALGRILEKMSETANTPPPAVREAITYDQ